MMMKIIMVVVVIIYKKIYDGLELAQLIEYRNYFMGWTKVNDYSIVCRGRDFSLLRGAYASNSLLPNIYRENCYSRYKMAKCEDLLSHLVRGFRKRGFPPTHPPHVFVVRIFIMHIDTLNFTLQLKQSYYLVITFQLHKLYIIE